MKLQFEHILLIFFLLLVLYYLSRCNRVCGIDSINGFSVGGEDKPERPENISISQNLNLNNYCRAAMCDNSPRQYCRMMCYPFICPANQCAMRIGSCCDYTCQSPSGIDSINGFSVGGEDNPISISQNLNLNKPEPCSDSNLDPCSGCQTCIKSDKLDPTKQLGSWGPTCNRCKNIKYTTGSLAAGWEHPCTKCKDPFLDPEKGCLKCKDKYDTASILGWVDTNSMCRFFQEDDPRGLGGDMKVYTEKNCNSLYVEGVLGNEGGNYYKCNWNHLAHDGCEAPPYWLDDAAIRCQNTKWTKKSGICCLNK